MNYLSRNLDASRMNQKKTFYPTGQLERRGGLLLVDRLELLDEARGGRAAARKGEEAERGGQEKGRRSEAQGQEACSSRPGPEWKPSSITCKNLKTLTTKKPTTTMHGTLPQMGQVSGGRQLLGGLPSTPRWRAWTSEDMLMRFTVGYARDSKDNAHFMHLHFENRLPSIPETIKIKMQDPNKKRYILSFIKTVCKQDTAMSRPEFFNWQLLDTESPAEELPWNVEEAVPWIACASG